MKWRSRETWLVLSVMAVAIVIAFLPGGEEGEPAAAAKVNPQTPDSRSAQQTPQRQTSQLGRVELERLSQQQNKAGGGKAITNAFNSTSWYVAPPRKPPAPPPPPPPSAPPLPFTYFGRYEDQQKLVVILANGSRLYTVSKGEVIDDTYRVDRITDGTVDLVYLPLNINQSLSIARAPEKK